MYIILNNAASILLYPPYWESPSIFPPLLQHSLILLHRIHPDLLPQLTRNIARSMPPILHHKRAEARVLRQREVVGPVPEDVVHIEARRGARRVRGLGGRVREGQTIAPLRVEVARRAARAGVGGAAAALGGELPVAAVGAGAGLEDLVCGAGVGCRKDVAAGFC